MHSSIRTATTPWLVRVWGSYSNKGLKTVWDIRIKIIFSLTTMENSTSPLEFELTFDKSSLPSSAQFKVLIVGRTCVCAILRPPKSYSQPRLWVLWYCNSNPCQEEALSRSFNFLRLQHIFKTLNSWLFLHY